jgi:copper chaperone CopZ
VLADLAKALLDRLVCRVELEGALVGVDGVRHLVVAGFVESAEVEPDFSEVGVDADGARVGIESVVELVDVVVKDTDRAPERRVLAVAVDGLLVRLVRLPEVVRGHIGATEEVPREGVVRVCDEGRVRLRSGESRRAREAHRIPNSSSRSAPKLPGCRRELSSGGKDRRAAEGPSREQGSPGVHARMTP